MIGKKFNVGIVLFSTYVLQLVIQIAFYIVGVYFFSSFFLANIYVEYGSAFLVFAFSVFMAFLVLKNKIRQLDRKIFIARLTAIYVIVGGINFIAMGITPNSLLQLIVSPLFVYFGGKYFLNKFNK